MRKVIIVLHQGTIFSKHYRKLMIEEYYYYTLNIINSYE